MVEMMIALLGAAIAFDPLPPCMGRARAPHKSPELGRQAMTPIAWSVSTAHEAFSPKLSRRFLERALSRGEIRTYRLGSARMILASDLADWIASQPIYAKRSSVKRASRFVDPDNEENVDG